MSDEPSDRTTESGPSPSRVGFVMRRLSGLAEAATVVLALGTAAGFLGSVFWILDLCSHFRMQGIVAGLALGLFLFLLRRPRFATIALGCAAIHLSLVVPLYFGGSDPAPEDEPGAEETIRFEVLLSNVNTLLGSPEAVARLIEEEEPDIVILQEINPEWIERLAPALAPYPHRFARPRNDNFGVGIFSRFPMPSSWAQYPRDASVPTLVAHLEIGEGSVQVIAAHPLPPIGSDYARRRDGLLAALPELIDPSSPILLIGDLNTTRWGHAFRRLVAESGLRDSAEGFGYQATWPVSPALLRIPIDHCLHSEDLRIVSRRVGPDVGSDHFPLLVEVEVPQARALSETDETGAR